MINPKIHNEFDVLSAHQTHETANYYAKSMNEQI